MGLDTGISWVDSRNADTHSIRSKDGWAGSITKHCLTQIVNRNVLGRPDWDMCIALVFHLASLGQATCEF